MDVGPTETCPLHGGELVPGTAYLFGGFFLTSTEYGRANNTVFGHACSWAPSGRASGGDRPRIEGTLYCPRCRQAERDWLLARMPEVEEKNDWEGILARRLGIVAKDSGQ